MIRVHLRKFPVLVVLAISSSYWAERGSLSRLVEGFRWGDRGLWPSPCLVLCLLFLFSFGVVPFFMWWLVLNLSSHESTCFRQIWFCCRLASLLLLVVLALFCLFCGCCSFISNSWLFQSVFCCLNSLAFILVLMWFVLLFVWKKGSLRKGSFHWSYL